MPDTEGRRRGKAAGAGTRRGKVMVRTSSGSRHPFLRGMVTHDLIQRGLSFDDAYAAASSIRDRITGRDEISTTELRDLIERQLEEMFGSEVLRSLSLPHRPVSDLQIVDAGSNALQPYSRGLLARSLYAAGLDLDRAYRLVTELEAELRQEGISNLHSRELARRVGDFVEEREGGQTARRYRLMRRIRRLPRPLVVYLGGASGTGKSTLALELSPLLRIYRINATDTIRQVMRMVFSPAILPAIHRSSFEPGAYHEAPFLEEPGGLVADRESHLRLISTFEEQATRVCVGVRAVVERAIAENMSIVVEGVHLSPRLVPFTDLEGAAYQVMLVLTTLDEEVHRARFLARGRPGTRRAERYLESFSAIRSIHEHLMEQAEAHDLLLLDTTDHETTLGGSLRLITGILEQRLPWLVQPGLAAGRPVPTLLLAVDGLPDRPIRALGNRTPLQAAHTPTLDRLAREGRCGLADPVAPGVVPDTASGSLALFSLSPLAVKRGPVEAMGAGIELSPTDIALRGNLATLDERGWVVDRRAGRIREGAEELADALDQIAFPGSLFDEVTVRVRVGTEHRLAIVLQGQGLSSGILGSDPGDGSPPGPPLSPRPEEPEDESAAHTARILALFEQEARKILARHPVNLRRQRRELPPANVLLTRGAGRIHRLPPLEVAGVSVRSACISGDRTVLGLAAWLGVETITGAGMTANLDSDLAAKFAAAREALDRKDLVVLHLKGADIASHDRRFDLKVEFLEKIDRHLADLLAGAPESLRVAVASDHATVSEQGHHASDPVPVLIWGTGVEADEAESFDEQAVVAGNLQRFPLQLLLSRLMEWS